MKNLIFTISILLMGLGVVRAQFWGNQLSSSYIPYHQYLRQNNTLLQNNSGIGRSVQDNEIAYRHDKWNAGDWIFSDSGSYSYSAGGNEISGTLYTYARGNTNWVNDTINTYTYDQSGNQLTHLTQSWNAATNSWVNETNFLATYNSTGKPLTQTYQVWIGNKAWLNTYNFVYTYDRDDNPTGNVEQVWSAADNSWINAKRTVQTNGTNQMVATQELQVWDFSTSTWVNSTNTIYSYDEHGNREKWIEQFWSSSNWVNFYKDSTVFDSNNNATAFITQQWDTVNLSWVNRYKSGYEFDYNNYVTQYSSFTWDGYQGVWTPVFVNFYMNNTGGKVLNQINENWNPTTQTYVNAYQGTYFYDQNNYLIQFADYYWGDQNNWVPNSSFHYAIDANNKTIYELDEVFNPADSTMFNSDQYYYFYTITDANTGLATVQNDLGAILYPNPTNGNNINVMLTLSDNADITLKTYDAKGGLINSGSYVFYSGSNDFQISYPDLSSGIYYIQLQNRTDNRVSVLRFVKN